MKFNPKPGDKIICNNGEEFICCTLDFLYAKGIRPSKPQAILGFNFVEETWQDWQDWDEDGYASLAPEDGYDIREVIPQSSEVTADKKEEVKEEDRYKAAPAEQPLYTVDEVFDTIFEVTKHLEIEIPWDYIDDVKEHLSRKNDPQYLEFLRLKEIYE